MPINDRKYCSRLTIIFDQKSTLEIELIINGDSAYTDDIECFMPILSAIDQTQCSVTLT